MGQLVQCPWFSTTATAVSVLSLELHGWMCGAGAGSTGAMTFV